MLASHFALLQHFSIFASWGSGTSCDAEEAGVVVFMIVRLCTGEYRVGGEFYSSQDRMGKSLEVGLPFCFIGIV